MLKFALGYCGSLKYSVLCVSALLKLSRLFKGLE